MGASMPREGIYMRPIASRRVSAGDGRGIGVGEGIAVGVSVGCEVDVCVGVVPGRFFGCPFSSSVAWAVGSDAVIVFGGRAISVGVGAFLVARRQLAVLIKMTNNARLSSLLYAKRFCLAMISLLTSRHRVRLGL